MNNASMSHDSHWAPAIPRRRWSSGPIRGMRNHATSAAVLAADPGATYRADDPYRAGDPYPAGDAPRRDVTPTLADALATPSPNTADPAPNTADPEDGGPAKSDALRVATERLEAAARDVVALLADT